MKKLFRNNLGIASLQNLILKPKKYEIQKTIEKMAYIGKDCSMNKRNQEKIIGRHSI